MPALNKPDIPLDSATIFDAVVIGAGPAGLSAALALCRVKRPAVVFSTPDFRNERAHHAHSVISRDHTPPSEIRWHAREQIDAYGTVKFVERVVTKARKNEDQNIFEVEDESGEGWRGKKVFLATGIRDILPTDIPGCEENWGESIWQCLICDGIERSHLPGGAHGPIDKMSIHNIGTMLQFGSRKATFFTNGSQFHNDESDLEALEMIKSKGAEVEERRIKELKNVHGGEGIEVKFEDGASVKVGFLAHRPKTELNALNFVADLGVEMVSDGMDGQMIKRIDSLGESSVPGVFAAGDVGILSMAVPQAMAQGQLAGVGVHLSISRDEEKEAWKLLKIGRKH